MDQKPGEKYIEKPPVREQPDDVLACWMDMERPCGPDCVAFDIENVDRDGRTGCILVNALKQGAIALFSFASKAQGPMPGSTHRPPGVTP